MVTKIEKRGAYRGVRLTKGVLRKARIDVGDDVLVSVREGNIIIERLTTSRKRDKLTELVARIPANHRSAELNWGLPIGKEVW
jgi:antitoxin component of MazEF toxin-antitoxin module